MHYPLIHHSNQRPYHFIHGYVQYLEEQLDVRIPVTAFRGDVHLSPEEKRGTGLAAQIPERFWIIVGGGKYDFTTKWWNPASYQAVVDHFRGVLQFVQCGEEGHWHPRLKGVTDMVGKTSLRQFVTLMHHAEGVICPVTFAMHLAAAVETKAARGTRPCVVIGGGREPAHWEAYPNHQFISTNGMLTCCVDGGCWKSRCQAVGDGDAKDRRDLCEMPVQIREDVRIPKCMEMITAADVIRRVEWYLEGRGIHSPASTKAAKPTRTDPAVARPQEQVLIHFRHGLGDAMRLTVVLRHLAKYRPQWSVTIAALTGKHTAFGSLCEQVVDLERSGVDESRFSQVFSLDWPECHECYPDSPSTKAERCLREVFAIEPDPVLYEQQFVTSEAARRRAESYLQSICPEGPQPDGRYPVVLIHYEGNTSTEMKNLSHETVAEVCETIIAAGAKPVILDWDHRSPLPDGRRIFNPDVDHPLWEGTGTGDAEAIAALVGMSRLMVGIDSGPLHVAACTATPTIAVWIGHHPLHYLPANEHVFHLVPRRHFDLLRGDRGTGEAYFRQHYQYWEYSDLTDTLAPLVASRLGDVEDGLVHHHGVWIRLNNAEQDMVIVRDIYEGDAYQTAAFASGRGPEVVVDIGAHIGCFAKRWHERNPEARIICVEACPENLSALRRNVGKFAEVVPAACSYEPGKLMLLNAVRPNCESTGGSVVVPREEAETTPLRQAGYAYWPDERELAKVTLEDLRERFGLDRIDVLKLDCEGSEYSILKGTSSLDHIQTVVGEYHDRSRWEAFRQEHLASWSYRQLHCGGEAGGLFHLERQRADGAGNSASQERQPLRLPPLRTPPLLRVAVPAGIGDSVWALTKIPAMLRAYETEKAHIALCGGPPHRSQAFIERFDFVASVENSSWICVEQPPFTKEGVHNWAPSQPGWHNEFDWMLQANRHLESGNRLEEWLPEFETDWQIADSFYFTGREVREARELEQQLSSFCVFYLGPEKGNTTSGHNRGPLWTPEQWGELARRCRELGLAIVVVGAEYDRPYFENHVSKHLGPCYDAVGKWHIGQTFAAIQRARFVIAYQSGIGIYSVYMGVPAAVFWRPHGDSIDPDSFVSFSEKMAAAWSPPGAVDSGRHLPLIYTRCSPETIVEHAVTNDWHRKG